MSETVTLDVTTLEETVSVTTTDGGTVEISVVAQRGETGATGPAGPNTVTSATTSDGTAELAINTLSASLVDALTVNAGTCTADLFNVESTHELQLDAGSTLTLNNTSFTYGTGSASAHRTALGLGTLATQSGTFSGTSSGTNTGDQTTIVGITGTTAQFNTANTDGDFATLAGSETLTNKTLTSPVINTGMTFGTGAAAATNTALGTTRVMRTTLATRTSGTMTADDTLVLPVLSGVTYRVRVHSLTKNSTATVGMVLRIDHPGITASGSDSVGHLMNGGGNAAITPSSSTSLTNSVNQNGQNLSTISEVILTPTANGNVSVVWAARVPAGVETAGLNIGSYLEVIRLS